MGNLRDGVGQRVRAGDAADKKISPERGPLVGHEETRNAIAIYIAHCGDYAANPREQRHRILPGCSSDRICRLYQSSYRIEHEQVGDPGLVAAGRNESDERVYDMVAV